MKEFWKAALIRALRTFCQSAVAVIGTSVLLSDVNWLAVLSSSALAAVLSILTSVATGLPEAPVEQEKTIDEEDPDIIEKMK